MRICFAEKLKHRKQLIPLELTYAQIGLPGGGGLKWPVGGGAF